MPTGSALFELPVVLYPEAPAPGRMLDYDELRPYLASDGSLEFSYGAVNGRPQADWQWQQVLQRWGPIKALPGLLGMGFDGIYVDTFGYADRGAKIRAQLTHTLGVQPLVSENGRELFFDMRPYAVLLGKTTPQLRALAQQMFGIAPPSR
jgi:phosphoglycerol transferase